MSSHSQKNTPVQLTRDSKLGVHVRACFSVFALIHWHPAQGEYKEVCAYKKGTDLNIEQYFQTHLSFLYWAHMMISVICT